MSLDRIRGLDVGAATAPRPVTLVGTGPRPQVSGLEVRPLDTTAVLRVLIEEVRSAAVDQLGFVPAPDREPFPVADRDRAATVLMKIMTTIAGDPRFQPPADEDPARLLQGVLRRGTDQAIEVLARLPVAGGVPRTLVEATREVVAQGLVDPVRQRTALLRSLQQALVVEAQRELRGSSSTGTLAPRSGASRYEGMVPATRPTLEALFTAILTRPAVAGQRVVVQDQAAALWARIEAPVRAAFSAIPEAERVLATLRERVLVALAPGLVPPPAASDEDSARRFLDRIATALAAAVSRPFSMPVAATDTHGIAAAVIDALRQIVDHPPAARGHEMPLASALDAVRGLLAREATLVAASIPARGAAATAVVEARTLLLRLLGSPEATDVARREPAIVVRWLAEVAAGLARDHGPPYRLDLVLPRRRPGVKRTRLPAAGPDRDDDPVAAIESRAQQGPPDTMPRHD